MYLKTREGSLGGCARQTHRDRLAELFEVEQLDVAMDRAARCAQATVAVFAAAPLDRSNETESAAIELAIEFFVPPASLELFNRELEAQLLRLNPKYVAGRNRGDFGPCVLRNIPFGAFHQHRVAWRFTADQQRQARWSKDRALLDEVLHQARVGWRDSIA